MGSSGPLFSTRLYRFPFIADRNALGTILFFFEFDLDEEQLLMLCSDIFLSENLINMGIVPYCIVLLLLSFQAIGPKSSSLLNTAKPII